MNRGAAKVNRVGLALLGLILLVGGGLALARGLGAFGATAARQPLLDGGVAGFARSHPWFWPAVAVASVILAVIGLGWLLALLRIDRVRRLRLESGASGVTEVEGRPASQAVARQVSEYPAVRHAHATLRGPSDAPRLDLGVSARESSDLSELVTRLHEEAVPDLRTTLGLNRLPTLVRLSLAPGRHIREVH